MKSTITALCLTLLSSSAFAQSVVIKDTKNIVQQEIELKLDAATCDLKISQGWGGMDSGDRCELRLNLPVGGKIIRAQVLGSDQQLSGEFMGDRGILFSSPDRFTNRQAFISSLTLAITSGKFTVKAVYVGPQM